MKDSNVIEIEDHKLLKNVTIDNILTSREGEVEMTQDKYVTKEELKNIEEKIDLKIKVAVLPIEGKIDNLPTRFKNLLLEERDFQDKRRKETQRYIWGTIIIGLSSIIVSVILHFI